VWLLGDHRIGCGDSTIAADVERVLPGSRPDLIITDPPYAWTIGQLEHGLVHVTHPRYFGLFNPAPTFPAQCADRIAARGA
jgi:DNA modification methylase